MKNIFFGIIILLSITSCSFLKQEETSKPTQSGESLSGAITSTGVQDAFVPEKDIKLILLKWEPQLWWISNQAYDSIKLEPFEMPQDSLWKMKIVLETILSIKSYKFSEEGDMYSVLFLSKAYIRDIFKDWTKDIIDFEWVFTGTKLHKEYIKDQIEKNIAQYTNNYEIRLNRSKEQWDCLFDDSEMCTKLMQTQSGTIVDSGTGTVQAFTWATDTGSVVE